MKTNPSFLLVALLSTLICVGDARAGGACNVNADCNDGNDCTSDTCNLGNHQCVHNPMAPGTPCGDSSDTVCTNPDTCDGSGGCLRNDALNGTACTAPNVCIADESCNGGFCVGTWTTNCCTAQADCKDHNDCTNDACLLNSCQHANVAAGTPCGSSVDDDCTDADTCDANGQCLANDTPHGEDCGGPDCLAGECGATTYRATPLPEGGNIGSEPRDGAWENDGDITVVGRVIAAGNVDHAAAWKCDSDGANCALTLLPEGGAGTSVANGVACDTSGTCLAVGSKGSPAQPAAWVSTDPGSGIWTAETVPLPGGFTGGSIGLVMDWPIEPIVGETVNPGGFRKATYWERTDQGVWSVFVLPDFGVPGRESGATDVVVCDANFPASICDIDECLIAGFAEDGLGVARPVVWRETAAFSDEFTMTVLPPPAGAVDMCIFPLCGGDIRALSFADVSATVDALHVGGTVTLSDGTTRGGVWKTADFSSWTSTVLPPLASHANSFASGVRQEPLPMVVSVSGSSYPTGGDPLLDGVATQWTLDPATLVLTSGPTDVNTTLRAGGGQLPSGCRFAAGFSAAGTETNGFFGGPVICPSVVAGTPQPHAAIAVAVGPAGIPTVSTWGMAVMTLLVLCAGTIVLRRAMRQGQTE